MATNRSAGRDVFIYDANDAAMVLGGLILTPGVTNANFYSMVEIIFILDQEYILRHGDDATVPRDNHPLQPGNYYIITDGIWRGFEAAHIFPLAYEGHWIAHNYGRWITIPPATESAGSINSVQNGMLLKGDIHTLFDGYDIAINPDDNYKIVCFGPDGEGIAGTHLDQQFRQDPHRPVDQLLRWHFWQAVLANMRGAGEPIFEIDFPPGTDMMGAILSGPMAAERMEFEPFSRLGLGVQ